MDEPTRGCIVAIHSSERRFVLLITGGGSGVAGQLLAVPGGSQSILEITVPYFELALSETLAARPESFCSVETAVAMARRALARAQWLAPAHDLVGVGCTASLRSDRPKRGDHRLHIAAATAEGTRHWSLTLTKDARDRAAEEEIVARAILHVMATLVRVSQPVPLDLLPGEELIERQLETGLLADFFLGNTERVLVAIDGHVRQATPPAPLIYPGSFNPLHEGHLRLALAASTLLNKLLTYEISITNVEKPPLAAEVVRNRLAQFTWRAEVWLTRAPTFHEKARLFPGATFVVGADTASRLVEPRFYASGKAMEHALRQIRELDCRFYVAGRLHANGQFLQLDDLSLPAAWRDLFHAIPANAFRHDLSSSELRAARN